MKVLQNVALAALVVAATHVPALAEVCALPDSGTYFIVNSASEEALEVGQAGAGQYVKAQEFTRGGLQKWKVDRKIDLKTKLPTNRYYIRLAGEVSDVNFQPHPIASMQPIISTDKSIFVLAPGEGGLMIKSVPRNGDALYIYPIAGLPTETRFGPSDGSSKFFWNFIPVEQ